MKSTIRSIVVHSSAFATALSVLALAGCQKNGFDTVYAGDGIVKFAPSVALTQDEDGTKGSATRGALINDNTNGGYSDIALPADNSFYATAWTTGASTADFGYTKVLSRGTGDSQYWITVDASDRDKEYLWKKGETKTFYAYANLPSASGAASVACTAAAEQTLTYDVTKVPTAAAQTDILLGFYTNGSTAKTDGLVPIHFSHPLTAVRFKLGKIIGASTFVVNSIGIEGVYASGTAQMTPSTAAQSNPEDRFTWNPTGSATVSQTITVQPAAEGYTIGEAFLLIPQAFTSESQTRIVISCNVNGTDRTLYWPLLSGSWKAGCTNGYVLNYDASGNLTLSVTAWGTSFPAEDLELEDPYNGHEYVEIGGIKWATMNVGATTVAGDPSTCYGDWFAWGETEPYYSSVTISNATTVTFNSWKSGKDYGYAWSSYRYCTGAEKTLTKYNDDSNWGNVDNKTSLEPKDDAATAKWGGSWRTPTMDDFIALCEDCGCTFVNNEAVLTTGGTSSTTEKGVYWCDNYDGVPGVLFSNGTDKVFFPATGRCDGTTNGNTYAGNLIRYWSSKVYKNGEPNGGGGDAWGIFSKDGKLKYDGYGGRYQGRAIRPVHD